MSKFIDTLPPDMQKRMRGWCSKGGKRGSHESKVKAGRAGMAAKIRNAQQEALRQAGITVAPPTTTS